MARFRSRRVTAIGAARVLALAAAGIVAGTQRAAGQEGPAGGLGGWQQSMGPSTEAPAQQAIGRAVSDMPAPMVGGSQTPAIAVGEGAVFVVAHGTLYRFDSRSLALQGSQRIPDSSSGGSLAAAAGAGKGRSAGGGSGGGGAASQEAPAAAQPGSQGTVRELLRRAPAR